MIITHLQWDSHRGPDSVGQHKLTFTMDESITSDFDVMKYKKGTQFTVIFIEDGSEEEQAFAQETKEQTLDRFRKQFYALITELCKLEDTDPNVGKEFVKARLIQEGKIKESTTELTLEQLAVEIMALKKYKEMLS